jgi:chromosome segregation ATPase
MLRFDVAVPEEVVHESEMLEKSLSSLHMSLKVEEMEAELVASIVARERAEAQNDALNLRLTALAEQLQEVRGAAFFLPPQRPTLRWPACPFSPCLTAMPWQEATKAGRAANAKLKGELSTLQASYRALELSSGRLAKEAEAHEEEVARTRKALTAMEKELQQGQTRTLELERRLEQGQKETDLMKEQKEALHAAVASLREQVASDKIRIKLMETTIAEEGDNYRALTEDVKRLESARLLERDSREACERELAGVRRQAEDLALNKRALETLLEASRAEAWHWPVNIRRCVLRHVSCAWRERSTQQRMLKGKCQKTAQRWCRHVIGLAFRVWAVFRRRRSRHQGYCERKHLVAVTHRFCSVFARPACQCIIVAVRER